MTTWSSYWVGRMSCNKKSHSFDMFDHPGRRSLTNGNSDSSDLASSNSSFEEETAITKVLRCGGVKEFVANQMWRLELSKWVENPNYKWINPTYPNYKWWLENPWKTIRCRSVDPSFLDDSPGGVNALTRKGTIVTRTVLSSVEPHTLW